MTRDDGSLATLPRAYLRPCVLLLLTEASTHGYELLEQLTLLGVERPDPGGVYRALRAMEQEGLVESCWEPSQTGPARRRYEVTAEGREWLHAWAGALRELRGSLDRYLERYEALPSPRPAAGPPT